MVYKSIFFPKLKCGQLQQFWKGFNKIYDSFGIAVKTEYDFIAPNISLIKNKNQNVSHSKNSAWIQILRTVFEQITVCFSRWCNICAQMHGVKRKMSSEDVKRNQNAVQISAKFDNGGTMGMVLETSLFENAYFNVVIRGE